MDTARGGCRCTRCARYRLRVATAFTTFGTCGVKVWIFKGEILEHDPMGAGQEDGRGRQFAAPPRRCLIGHKTRFEGSKP